MLLIACLFMIPIFKNWDFSKTSSYQYSLEKRSYLINTIIYFSLLLKIFLIGYFIYTLDTLSKIIPGAMCATGVINFNDYGNLLLVNKIILLFFCFNWLVVNYFDLKATKFPYFKIKNFTFLGILFLAVFEIVLDVLFFTNLSTESLATCCSIFYDTSASSPIPFGMDTTSLLLLFYTLFFILLFVNYKKLLTLSILVNIFFSYIAYYALIYFFGTYIYELPTHYCPYCMLQADYGYIGYLLFISMFFGLFFSLNNGFLKLFLKIEKKSFYLYSSLFYSIFTVISTGYVLIYYLKNGVLL